MKKINENTKVTLTLGQLRRLVKEAADSDLHDDKNSADDYIKQVDIPGPDTFDILKQLHQPNSKMFLLVHFAKKGWGSYSNEWVILKPVKWRQPQKAWEKDVKISFVGYAPTVSNIHKTNDIGGITTYATLSITPDMEVLPYYPNYYYPDLPADTELLSMSKDIIRNGFRRRDFRERPKWINMGASIEDVEVDYVEHAHYTEE